MPLATGYNETTLAQFMHDTLGNVAAVLNLSVEPVGGSYLVAIHKAMRKYGAATLAEITEAEDLQKLEALATVEAWTLAVNNLGALHSFTADGASYQRNQMHTAALSSLKAARQEALKLGIGYEIVVGQVTDNTDPYIYFPPDGRPLIQ